jgi:hypothetical protein
MKRAFTWGEGLIRELPLFRRSEGTIPLNLRYIRGGEWYSDPEEPPKTLLFLLKIIKRTRRTPQESPRNPQMINRANLPRSYGPVPGKTRVNDFGMTVTSIKFRINPSEMKIIQSNFVSRTSLFFVFTISIIKIIAAIPNKPVFTLFRIKPTLNKSILNPQID